MDNGLNDSDEDAEEVTAAITHSVSLNSLIKPNVSKLNSSLFSFDHKSVESEQFSIAKSSSSSSKSSIIENSNILCECGRHVFNSHSKMLKKVPYIDEIEAMNAYVEENSHETQIKFMVKENVFFKNETNNSDDTQTSSVHLTNGKHPISDNISFMPSNILNYCVCYVIQIFLKIIL